MKAIGLYEFGGPEVLQVVELPERSPGQGEVRIRVHAAAVNPSDLVRRAGVHVADGTPDAELEQEERPVVLGMDFAGVVDVIGPDTITDLVPGDNVMGVIIPIGSSGGYSEYVVVPATWVVRAPAGADAVAASTVPMNGMTALTALDALDLRPGQTIGVTGAAGVLGGYVVQLANARGLRVICDASEQDRTLCERLGAHVVVARGSGVAERMFDASGGGVDGLADCAVLNEQVVGAVRPGGRFVTVRRYVGGPDSNVTFHPIRVRHHLNLEWLEDLRRSVEEGNLTPRVAGSLPAEEAAEAHRRFERGGVRGRLVLKFP